MIKANELRIGNIVELNNPKARPSEVGKHAIVVGIDARKSFGEFVGSASVCLIEDEYQTSFGQFLYFLQPIPLTEEWLVEFGFEKNDEGRYDKRMELSLIENCYHFRQGWTNVKVKHVHQLQNLYHALTGEELVRKCELATDETPIK